MGLTQRLGTIPLAIQTDSSNNVGIGGTPSGSFKFEAIGLTRLASSGATILTINSTNANGSANVYQQSGTNIGWIGNGSSSLIGGSTNDFTINGQTNINLAIGGFSRVIVNSSGNVGIGTNTPSARLTVYGGEVKWGFTSDLGALSYTDNKPMLASVGATDFLFYTNATERMRIPSGGGLCVGGTSFSGLNTAVSVNSASNSGFILQTGGTNRGYFYTSGNNTYIETTNSGLLYCWVNGANGVYLTAGSTSWTANSDERLKDITGNIENAVDSLLTLRTVKHTWKTAEDKTEHLALIAQDVEKVLPQLIDKYIIPAKRGEEQIDKTEYLGVRYTELIPVLVKAIQELNAKVTALENK